MTFLGWADMGTAYFWVGGYGWVQVQLFTDGWVWVRPHFGWAGMGTAPFWMGRYGYSLFLDGVRKSTQNRVSGMGLRLALRD